jgi:hypothetical protein
MILTIYRQMTQKILPILSLQVGAYDIILVIDRCLFFIFWISGHCSSNACSAYYLGCILLYYARTATRSARKADVKGRQPTDAPRSQRRCV